ncbi:MAG: hypothetical protein ACLP0J_27375 [Solirubrobacteraceae bacterium]
MVEIALGLWRWISPHPAWMPGAQPGSPDDWDQYVGSVLYEDRNEAVFIDPLVPGDADRFWSWADERVGGRRAVVLTTLGPHRRSREQLVQRYGASTSRAKRNLPPGVLSIVLRGAGETMFCGEMIGMIKATPLADLRAQPQRRERVDPAQAPQPRDRVRARRAQRELREVGL